MTENTSPGVFASLRSLLGDVVDIGRTRLALLANEVEEEKLRLVGGLVHSILALACLIIGVVLLVAFLALLFWEQRLVVLGLACLVFLSAAVVFARRSLSGLERGSGLFKASLAELEADVASLKKRGQDESPSA
ncbi:MAG: phage holin family protein [Azovibrio sp.]|uniref:phage holin family protein n=1 Tax=Azovibrio sp. TaxID=1872673 RepID=UPI003C71B4DE